MREATAHRTRSPARWPWASLTALKRSRSTNSTAAATPVARHSPSTSRSWLRLARPVRLSWAAAWVRRSLAGPAVGDIGDRAHDRGRPPVGPAFEGLAAHRQPAPVAVVVVKADDLVALRQARSPAPRSSGPARPAAALRGRRPAGGWRGAAATLVPSATSSPSRVRAAGLIETDGAVGLHDDDAFAERGHHRGEAALGQPALRRGQQPVALVGADRHLAARLARSRRAAAPPRPARRRCVPSARRCSTSPGRTSPSAVGGVRRRGHRPRAGRAPRRRRAR